MRRALLPVLLAPVIALFALPVSPAAADAPLVFEHPGPVTPNGRACGVHYVPGSGTTVLESGPITLPGADALSTTAFRVQCALQEGGTRHTDSDAIERISAYSSGVASLPPTTFAFTPDTGWNYTICTRLDIQGSFTQWFWDDSSQSWTTSNSARCSDVTSVAGAGDDVPNPGDLVPDLGDLVPDTGCAVTSGLDLCVAYTPGNIFQTASVVAPTTTSLNVIAQVYLYDIALPTGGVLSVPCVVLDVAGVDVDPCADLDGTRTRHVATLLDNDAPVPSGAVTPILSVSICRATLTVTVEGIGVRDFPVFAVC